MEAVEQWHGPTKIIPFLRVVKCQNFSKKHVSNLSPQMLNFMSYKNTKRHIFLKNEFFQNFFTIFGLSGRIDNISCEPNHTHQIAYQLCTFDATMVLRWSTINFTSLYFAIVNALITNTYKTKQLLKNPLPCPTELRAQITVFVGPHNVLREELISDKFSSTLHSTGQYCKKIKGELCCRCKLDL